MKQYIKNVIGRYNQLSEKKQRWNTIFNTLVLILWPVVCFLLVEFFLDSDFLKIRRLAIVCNILIYMLIMYGFYVVTASVRASVIGVTTVAVAFAIINIYLIEFRQIPLLASDLTVIKTAANVARDFDFRPNTDIILLLCILCVVVVLATKLKQEKLSKKRRIVHFVCYMCFFVSIYHLMIGSDELGERGISINTFRPIKTYDKNGGILTFVRSIRLMIVEKPEGYSRKAVEKIMSNYPSDDTDSKEFVEPNVIVIMNEAFTDLQSVGDFETNQEVLPFYNSLQEDTIKGFAYVSVFGGQTANSEFEFLTGDSKAYLPQGGTPYQFYIKEYLPALTGNLKLDGYQGLLALHPYRESGYNRVNVYENMGFSDFISKEDFGDVELVRNHISDVTNYNRIIEEYEKAKKESDAPFYLFNVTMQNHSPYNKDFKNLPKTIKITTKGCKNADAERFLNLIHLSDAATKNLVAYFEKKEEPTVIVMFGDHEPGLSNRFYKKIIGKHPDDLKPEEAMQLYKVPFFIWANYDIEEQYIERTSLNYLQTLMLDATGMKMSGYNKYLKDLMQDVPAINFSGYYDKNGTFYSVQDQNSPYYEQLKEYQYLEYNHLFDNKRMNTFFEFK